MGSRGWVKDLIHEFLYLYKSLLYIQLNICKQIPLKLKGTFLHCDTGLDDTVLFLVGGRNTDLGSRWSLRNFVSQSRPPLPIAVGRTICFFFILLGIGWYLALKLSGKKFRTVTQCPHVVCRTWADKPSFFGPTCASMLTRIWQTAVNHYYRQNRNMVLVLTDISSNHRLLDPCVT